MFLLSEPDEAHSHAQPPHVLEDTAIFARCLGLIESFPLSDPDDFFTYFSACDVVKNTPNNDITSIHFANILIIFLLMFESKPQKEAVISTSIYRGVLNENLEIAVSGSHPWLEILMLGHRIYP
jgi:hypothetical protein